MVNQQPQPQPGQPDIVSELLSLPPTAPGPQAGAAGGAGSGSGLLTAPTPQPPPVSPTGNAVAPSAAPAPPPPEPKRIPLDMAPAGVVEAFEHDNGRKPTPSELASVNSAALLTQQLGRRPSRRELFQQMYGRAENKQAATPFTLDV